jgi:hypothetical protein
MPHRHPFEPTQVGRQMPGQIALATNDIVFRNGNEKGEFHDGIPNDEGKTKHELPKMSK